MMSTRKSPLFERFQTGKSERFASERGITLFITAAGMFALIGFIALAVDTGYLYTARADCQKIADAAALAGAKEAFFYAPADPVATAKTAAISAARANYTAIDSNDNRLQNADILVNTTEHTVQVTVLRTAANSNPVQTFFGKIFGIATADVSAMATAEVYRPTGLPFGAKCIKPWLMPDRYDFGSGVFETIDQDDRGKTFNVKQGDSSMAVAGGQYLIANMPQGSTPPSCPACGDPSGALNGGNLYRQNISCCNRNPIFCGQLIDYDTTNGNKVGPTVDGVSCLIHEDKNTGLGQDILLSPTAADPTAALKIQPGPNNPLSSNPSVTYVTNSDSLIVVPMFDASVPITSGQTQLLVVGFMQVFIHSVGNPQGTVSSTIINVTRCTPGGPGPISGAIGTPLPLRLVRNSGT
jgi:Flp pilus assembly protein TadG